MYKKLTLILAVIAVLGFVGTSLAAPPFTAKQVIKYDGYLQEDATGNVLADTLFVVNNYNKKMLPVWIEVYDKYGTLVVEGTLLNGGSPLEDNLIPVRGFGWVTLGMMVTGPTHDPYGFEGYGQKFTVIISTGKADAILKATIVEVKQVIYETAQQYPGEAIWNAAVIKTWAETALGGLRGPGLVKIPGPGNNWDK